MRIKKFDEHNKVNEDFEPSWILLAATWINLMSDGGVKGIKKRIPNNLKLMKRDFIKFANWMGYPIEEDALDYRFNQIINGVKNKLKKNESAEIEIYSDSSNKSIKVSKDDITLLLDRGYIWQDDSDYSFKDEHYWVIQQMINGYGS